MWSDASSRYNTPISGIFSAENKLKLQLLVEAKLASTQAKLNIIDQEDANNINQALKHVDLSRVNEIEKEIHHDVMSVVKAIAEKSGSAGGKVHLGATSSDIQDTVLALQLVKSRRLLLDKLDKLSEVIANLAEKYKDLPMIGRTHGQFAVPIVVGFKFANYLYELHLAKENLFGTSINLSKFSGAVGNYASSMRMDIESELLESLELKPTKISTQVVTRLIHAQYMNALALCSSIIERIAKEIRNLQRSEINEWMEPFMQHQVGSSSMPHKKNPHKSERISGLSRVIRGNVAIALENISLEHERDITHSSVERIIIPESTNLLYYITEEIIKILDNLVINEINIKRNLEKASDVSKTEEILKHLVPAIGRQRGHEMLRKHALSKNFKDSLLTDNEILKHISKEKLADILNTENVGLSKPKIEQILKLYHEKWRMYRS